jgi:hypothetical protein
MQAWSAILVKAATRLVWDFLDTSYAAVDWKWVRRAFVTGPGFS